MSKPTASYWDDYTPEEREKVREKMVEKGCSWKEVIDRYGHPSEWQEEQLKMF